MNDMNDIENIKKYQNIQMFRQVEETKKNGQI
jgi:hypothetical protein